MTAFFRQWQCRHVLVTANVTVLCIELYIPCIKYIPQWLSASVTVNCELRSAIVIFPVEIMVLKFKIKSSGHF